MKTLSTCVEIMNWRKSLSHDCTVGFVPTMGALHSGHASLLKKAVLENDITVASIFVNPTQFNNADDLRAYPRTLTADENLLRDLRVDVLFAPQGDEIYPDDFRYRVSEESLANKLCGGHRPGHFTGVLTVVLKLLQLTSATRAYFGEKDYQQLQLIKGMAGAFFLPTQIIACPTLREADGLAMSSRNVNLTPAERSQAPFLYQAISRKDWDLAKMKAELTRHGFRLDYLEEYDGRRFAAAFLGKVRLIDNVQI